VRLNLPSSTKPPLEHQDTVTANRALPQATALLTVALLAAMLLAQLFSPSSSSARESAAACVSRAVRPGEGVRACAQRRRQSRTRTRRESRGKHGATNGKHKTTHGSAGKVPAQAQLQPATCEDASTPVREADGSYACADGSEPACTDGAEPVAAGNGSDPVCPATAAEVGGVECEDGSVQGGATGSSGCDEGAQPECEDGSQPTLSEDGWTLECPLSAEAGTVPSWPTGEEPEEALSSLLANSS
jgi:hypothetical protein